MNVQKATRQVETRQAEFNEAVRQRDKLSASIQVQKAEIERAEDACLDARSEKEKVKLKGQMSKLDDARREDLARLRNAEKEVVSAEAALNSARENLLQAQAEREVRRKQFEEEEIEKDSQAIFDSFEKLYLDTVEALILFQTRMGELAVSESILNIRRDEGGRLFAQKSASFRDMLDRDCKARGLAPLDGYVWRGAINCTPGVIVSGSPDFNIRSTQSHAERRDALKREEIRKKFDEREIA